MIMLCGCPAASTSLLVPLCQPKEVDIASSTSEASWPQALLESEQVLVSTPRRVCLGPGLGLRHLLALQDILALNVNSIPATADAANHRAGVVDYREPVFVMLAMVEVNDVRHVGLDLFHPRTAGVAVGTLACGYCLHSLH